MRPRLSASGLWRAERCPASAVLPPARRDYADAEAGRKEHARLELVPLPGGIPEVAFAYNALTGEAREIGRGVDREYGELDEGEIPGTTDLLSIEEGAVRVRDYKTGYGYDAKAWVAAPAENLQLGHYALSAAKVYGKPLAIVEIEHTATGEVLEAELDAFAMVALEERIRRIWTASSAENPQVIEGEQCWRCECYAQCPAKTALALTIASGQLPTQLPTLELTPAAVATGWERLKAAKKLLSEVERVYRGFASEQPIPLGNGKVLGERVSVRDSVDGATAFEVLKARFGETVAREAVAMDTSKAAIERAIGPHCPPRGKAAQMRLTLEAIETAGGISKDFSRRVEEYEDRGAESAA